MKALAFAAIFFLFGCAQEQPKLQELAISPDFEPYQQDAILRAADEWFEHVPEKFVPVYVGPDRGLGSVVPSSGCAGVAGLMDNIDGSPRIVMCPGLAAFTHITALHEIGHMLAGRPGHLDKGNIMSPEIASYTQEITPRDVAFIRGEIGADQK